MQVLSGGAAGARLGWAPHLQEKPHLSTHILKMKGPPPKNQNFLAFPLWLSGNKADEDSGSIPDLTQWVKDLALP